MEKTKCEACGHAIELGDFPFCPHGKTSLVEIGDEIDETLENVGPRPVRFRSRAEKARYLKEHGLTPMVRHVPHPAGNQRNHTTDWGAHTDPYTEANVKELLERAFANPIEEEREGPLLVRDVHPLTERERELYGHSDH